MTSKIPNGRLNIPSNHEIFTLQRIEFQDKMLRSGHWLSCLNCDYWAKKNGKPTGVEQCELFKAVPPIHVIVNGCKDHMDDIPF
jgi:hypothetical protein